MVTATDTSEVPVSNPIECQKSSPEELEQYWQMCDCLNKKKQSRQGSEMPHWLRWRVGRLNGHGVGGAMEQREVELQHQHGAAVLQQQQIPISRHLTPNPPNPQHQQQKLV